MLKNLPQTYRKRNLFLLLVTQIPKLVQQAKRYTICSFKMMPEFFKRKGLAVIASAFVFLIGMVPTSKVFATNVTCTWVSVTPTNPCQGVSTNYTLRVTYVNDNNAQVPLGKAVVITFPSGFTLSGITGGTYNGTAIGTITTTATTVSFSTPVAVSKNTTFNIVLTGITNSNTAGNYQPSMTVDNNTGTGAGNQNVFPAGSTSQFTITPNATISLTSTAGTNAQTPCINTAITNITYAVGGGGIGAGVTGLPTGVSGSFSGGVFTISGTSTAAAGIYNYTVTTTGTCAQTSTIGSITIKPNATISLTSSAGTNAQTPCINTAITNITYAVGGGGTGAGVTGLPAGVTGSYSGGVFTISGTPTAAAGIYNYTVTTTGTCAQATATGSITVKPDATITLTSAAGTDAQTPCINTAITNITYAVGGGGTGAGVTGLPAGVTGSFSGGVFTISGTPTAAAGTYNYTVTTTGTCAQTSATGSITIKSNATIVLTSAAGTDAQTTCINTAISDITYSIGGGGTGGTVSGLPAGVTGSYSGGVFTISGTPTVAGTFNYTVSTTGTCSQASATGTITANPSPQGTLTTSDDLCTSGTGQLIWTATAGTGPFTVVYNDGVADRTQTNVTSGTPFNVFTNPVTATTTYTLISITDNNGCVRSSGFTGGSATISVSAPPAITVQPDVSQTVCATFSASFTVSATGDGLTYQWFKGAAQLSDGGSISGSNTATLTIDPAALSDAGTYHVVVSGLSPCGSVTSEDAILNVDQQIFITTDLANQTVCEGNDATFTIASTGSNLRYTWKKGATILSDGGNISGATTSILTISNATTADAGQYSVTITDTLADVGSCNVANSKKVTLSINTNSTINLSSAAGTDAQTVCINNAIANIRYSVGGGGTGATVTGLPAGVTGVYNSSSKVFTISGTPTASGTFNYTVTTTGPCVTPSLTGTITVNANSTISLTSGTNNQAVCINTAIADIAYTIGGDGTGATVSGLPAGVTGTFNAGVFTISGTPSASGTFNYTVTTQGPCVNPSLTGTITVNANSTISLTSGSNNPTACINSAIGTIKYTVGGGGTGATVSGLPSGVTGSYNSGVFTISGTPTASGTFNYTVTATGPCVNPSLSGTITVNPTSAGGTISPAVTTGCSGAASGTLTLSGQTGSVIRWESSTNGGTTWTSISNTTTTLSYTNLTQTTLFRAVIQSGICGTANSGNAVVSVVPQQAPSPVTAMPATICAGQTALLSAGTGYQSIGVDTSGNFNNGNPKGWCVDGQCTGSFMAANGDNTQNGTWRETNAHRFPNNGPFYKAVNGKFAIANGPGTFTLETPVFSLVGQTTATLSFFQAYILKIAGTSVTVSISMNGGSTYTTLTQTTGVTSLGLNGTGDTVTMQPASIDLSSYIGLSNLRIKFTYIGSANSSWVLDGVSLPGTLPITYAWTDPSTIITDPTKDTVRVQPATTTTYTITTFVGGCPAGNATVTVTVNPIPDAVATLAEQTSCSSAAFTISLSGNVTGTSFDWTRDNTSNVTGMDPSGSTSGDINGTLTDTFSMMQDVTFTITPTANGCVGSPVTAVVHVTQCVILPVAIINLIAYQKGGNVQIDWTALNEINVDHYEVERSTNGMSFTSLGNVKALNNAASINHSKIDPSPVNGKNFYRIKAVDKNGAITYTGIALVNISNGKSSISIYPNPVQNRIVNVQFTNLPAGNYNLILYNVLGQSVLSRKIEHAGGSATQSFTLPVNAVAGAYIVKFFNKTFDFTSRLVVE